MAELSSNQLADRAALVPGGAGGIGCAVCQTLARRGATVTVADVDLERAQAVATALPGAVQHTALAVDVGDAAAVEATVGTLERIDFLVYCAGNNVKAPSLELSAAQWRAALDSHLTGAFLFSQAVGRHLVARGRGGRIVYISSVGAWAPIPERGAYSPSKAAPQQSRRMLAVEWARYGINVNTVCPGVAATPMTTRVYARDRRCRRRGASGCRSRARSIRKRSRSWWPFCAALARLHQWRRHSYRRRFSAVGFMPEPTPEAP